MALGEGEKQMMKRYGTIGSMLCVSAMLLGMSTVRAQDLDELSLDGWKQLGETERYQLQVAEKYWREKDYKTAAAEYEKFMELYEQSSGAPFAQLKWSLAQVKLRKQNTAIKEGFQTVIDYWPESAQATAASYYIGRTLRDIGRTKEAKTALKSVIAKYPGHQASVFALSDLAAIADVEKDIPARVEAWKKLTFEAKRSGQANNTCVNASQNLGDYQFRQGAFEEGMKALATTYKGNNLSPHVLQYLRSPLNDLMSNPKTVAAGGKLADDAISWFQQNSPSDRTTDEAKQLARHNLFAVAETTALARRDDKVPAAYEAIVKELPGDDEALGRLAGWYKSKSDFEKARAVYGRYANKFEGLGQIAYSHREQQKWPLAVEAYTRLINEDAEHKTKWKPELAMTYRSFQKWPEAVALYEQLYTEDLGNANRWRWEIATTYKDAGQLKEAIGHFRQAANFPENYKQMAWCHRHLKQPTEAVALYNQIAAGDKSQAPWAMLQVAYTREEAGEKETAIQAFQTVCKRFPKDGHAGTAHAHLQQKYKISVTLGGATEE